MLFLDEVKIFVRAGTGGSGSAHFCREAHRPDGGPDGGHGGNGGNVVLMADESLNTLVDFFNRKKFVSENGQSGGANSSHGKKGKDLILKVPVGTMVLGASSKTMLYDLTKNGQTCIIAHGGTGGVGNIAFKSSINQAPKQKTLGKQGEEGYFILSMRLTADIGLIGLPNAGKSSLLAFLTNAKPKVGDYPFTTTTPSLGFVEAENYEGFILADIPGLIEGSHLGYGLGHKFLKHIEKCNILFHVLDASSKDPIKDYLTVQDEMGAYNQNLLKKKGFIILNKSDAITPKKLQALLDKFSQFDKPVYSISSFSHKFDDQKNNLIRDAFHLIKTTVN